MKISLVAVVLACIVVRAGVAQPPEGVVTEDKIRAVLAKAVSLEFRDTALGEVIEFLANYSNLNIVLDRANLDLEGVTLESPVTIHVERISLRSALHLLLDQLNLDFVIADQTVLITTPAAVRSRVTARTYRVGPDEKLAREQTRLVEMVLASARRTAVAVEHVPAMQTLLVWENAEGHALVNDVLQKLADPKAAELETVRAIRAALQRPVNLEFRDTAFQEVIEFVQNFAKINVVADRRALEEEGASRETPITIRVEQLPLGSALDLLLRQLNLAAIVQHECLVITTEQTARTRRELRVYPVAELVPAERRPSAESWGRIAGRIQEACLREFRAANPPDENAKPEPPGTPSRFAAPLVAYSEPRGCLVVYGTESAHRQVAATLRELAKASPPN